MPAACSYNNNYNISKPKVINMAKVSTGILGGFSGTVGNVVGSYYNGVNYMRAKPSSYNDAKTEAQLAQRERFGLIQRLLKRLKTFIQAGFPDFVRYGRPLNRALSYNIRNAIEGAYPGQTINYANLLVSEGDLTRPQDPVATSPLPGELSIEWINNSDLGSAEQTDQLMLLVYSPVTDDAVEMLEGPTRDAEIYSMMVPQSYEGHPVHVYVAFKNEDGHTSDSVYAGEVTIANDVV